MRVLLTEEPSVARYQHRLRGRGSRVAQQSCSRRASLGHRGPTAACRGQTHPGTSRTGRRQRSAGETLLLLGFLALGSGTAGCCGNLQKR